jgi:hypothetical protein
MRFTDNAEALKQVYVQRDTLQVYSVKLAATRGSLQLPLDVFGMVAVRDPVDHNRNIIFQRNRDECQTLTEKVGSTFYAWFFVLVCNNIRLSFLTTIMIFYLFPLICLPSSIAQ